MFRYVLIHSLKNPCSGCDSGIDLVVALECIFFQLCSNAEQIYVRLARFRRSYVKPSAVVLTSLIAQRFCLMYAAVLKVATFLFLQMFVPDDSVFAYTIFVEHTSSSNVVNSKVGKQTKRRKDVK